MADYFSHDYDAREDDKIQRLIYDLGWEGYGLYWAIIEMLYSNEGYLTYECERIAYSLRTQCEYVVKIINDYDLFIVDGNRFSSKSVLSRLMLRKAKSERARESAKSRWNNELHANASQKLCERNAIKESKVNKIKDKDTLIKIKEIVEFLNFKTGKKFRHQTDSTTKHIKGRLNEGFSVADFKQVIDTKTLEWKDTDMDKYLRPETLFNPKNFEAYLNQRPVVKDEDIKPKLPKAGIR